MSVCDSHRPYLLSSLNVMHAQVGHMLTSRLIAHLGTQSISLKQAERKCCLCAALQLFMSMMYSMPKQRS